jgi:AcrR family transcriptional regulator
MPARRSSSPSDAAARSTATASRRPSARTRSRAATPQGDPRAARLAEILDAALRVFLERSYRRAQMADVARELGVSPGTLYNYVESKEALFHLIVEQGFRDEPLTLPPTLPLSTPAPGATLESLRGRFGNGAPLPLLDAALARRRAADPRAELETIVRELYQVVSRNRRGIILLERSAHDWPELAEAFYTGMRRSMLKRLERYLDLRMRAGQLRDVPDRAACARLINETIAWFAMHRLGDRDSADVAEPSAEATVVDVLVHGFAKE